MKLHTRLFASVLLVASLVLPAASCYAVEPIEKDTLPTDKWEMYDKKGEFLGIVYEPRYVEVEMEDGSIVKVLYVIVCDDTEGICSSFEVTDINEINLVKAKP